MLLPLKLVCPTSKKRRDGTCLVFIQYCRSHDDKTLLNTEIAIPPQYWHKKHNRIIDRMPSTYGNSMRLNEEIHRMFRIAEEIVKYAIAKQLPDPVVFLKQTFKPQFNIIELQKSVHQDVQQLNLDFFYQLNDYIESKKRQVTPNMINVFNNLRDTLRAFQNFKKMSITFESIDYNFYETFLDYMLNDHVHRRRKQKIRGFKISTAGKTIKQLRIFLRNRMRKKIIPFIDLHDFKIIDEESDAIYLSYDEIIAIYEIDLSKNVFLEKYRDLFVVGCLTGLRFSDFSDIKSTDIRNGMVYKKQGKSDHWVVIPMRDIAEFILVHKFKRIIPKFANADFNLQIKKIGKLAGITELITFSHKRMNQYIKQTKPKYEWITSHTCRRSFCTNEFLNGTPVELIMKISGHRSIRDFYKYIRITPEEAGKKIKEIWERRGEIKITV